MSISALTSGTSGLTANQRALDVAANNIANANTPGFQPQQAAFQESSPAGTGVTLSVEGRKLAASESVSGANATAAKAAESRPKAGRTASAWRPN